ncbi:MAG: hypothetical protein HN509_18900 [Halobacteriovoraceae bacterium]|jgi:hypothetical protein|nr:hypothetical protein [Halobacteriovoraceae bacterium]MBT5093267.1 hypothetical protein [Halobacteriovoraceae bacterium]
MYRELKTDLNDPIKSYFLGVRGGYALGFLGIMLIITSYLLQTKLGLSYPLERLFGIFFIFFAVSAAVSFEIPMLFPPRLRENKYLSPKIFMSTLLGNISGSLLFAFLLYFLGAWTLGGLEFIAHMVITASQNLESNNYLLFLKGTMLIFFLCSTIGLISNVEQKFLKIAILALSLSLCYILKIDQLIIQIFLLPASYLAQRSILLNTINPRFTIEYVTILSSAYILGGTLYMGASYGFKNLKEKSA